jgi:hypothetical protein
LFNEHANLPMDTRLSSSMQSSWEMGTMRMGLSPQQGWTVVYLTAQFKTIVLYSNRVWDLRT